MKKRFGKVLLVVLVLYPVTGAGACFAQVNQASSEAYERGLKTLSVSPDTYPPTEEGKRRLAQTLSHEGHYDLALKLYNELLNLQPENPDLLLGRGLVRSWRGNYDGSLRDLRAAADLAPNYTDVHEALGRVYYRTERYDSALASYNRLIELHPDNGSYHLEKARVLEALDQTDRALAVVGDASDKEASASSVRSTKRQIRRGLRTAYWTGGLGIDFTTLEGDRSNWRNYRFRVGRRTERRTLFVEYQRMRRFDQWDGQFSFDGYHSLWDRSYLNMTYRRSPDHDFLPQHDGRFELFQGFGTDWEASLNFRRMAFDAVNVEVFGLSLARTWQNWYWRGNLEHSVTDRGERGEFGRLTVRYYYRGTRDDYWELSGGVGKNQITVGTTNQVTTQRSNSLGLRWERFWTPRWGTELAFNYTSPDVEPTRRRFSFWVNRRWY